MSGLSDLLLRSSVPLLAGVLFDVVAASRPAALRHRVLALSIAAALAIAPLSLVFPAWRVDLPLAAAPVVATPPSPAPSVARVAPPSPFADALLQPRSLPVIPVIWFGGTIVMASAFLLALVRLRRIASRGVEVADVRWNAIVGDTARSLGITRPIRVIQTSCPELLATWGARRPVVILPAHAGGWSEERLRVVLIHELAHVARYDWIVQVAAESARALAWFHPLIWIVCTRLRRAAEQACDDVVLGTGAPPRAYATHLIELARQCRPAYRAVAMPMAHPSALERRIVAMLNPRLNRRPLSRRSGIAAGLLLVALAVPTALLRGQDAPRVLSGALYDTSGAVLPGVSVTLEDATQAKTTATTDASGRFQFGTRSAGKYVLVAALPGFRSLRQEFELKTPADWDRAVTLPIGTLSESITVQATRMTAPATATQPQSAPRVRVGGNIRAPRKTLDVRPVYPDSMRAAGREGVVSIEAVIGVDGTVSGVRVLSADIHPDFAIAAIDAVRQWKFTPTLLNGAPVEVVMTVKVTFNLAQ